MKIMICASMKFSESILKTKKFLENKGHEVLIPLDTKHLIDNPDLTDNLDADYKHLKETDMLRKCFNLVADSDAILVLNHEKNGIKGYIGTSVLMEIGLAHFLNKKIFLINELPHFNEQRWSQEVHAMQPIVINGNLEKI